MRNMSWLTIEYHGYIIISLLNIWGGEEGSPLTTASNEDSMIIIDPEDLNSSSPDVQQIEFK